MCDKYDSNNVGKLMREYIEHFNYFGEGIVKWNGLYDNQKTLEQKNKTLRTLLILEAEGEI